MQSQQYSSDEWRQCLKAGFASIGSDAYVTPFYVFRGDSFQGITDLPYRALRDAITLRLWLRMSGIVNDAQALDARISIGVGYLKTLIANESTDSSVRVTGAGCGGAFDASRMGMDTVRTEPCRVAVWAAIPDTMSDDPAIDVIYVNDAALRKCLAALDVAILRMNRSETMRLYNEVVTGFDPAVPDSVRRMIADAEGAYRNVIERVIRRERVVL